MVAGPKKRYGSAGATSTLPSRREMSVSGQKALNLHQSEDCKLGQAGTRLLLVVDSISGLDGWKTKAGQELKYPVEVSVKVTLGETLLGVSDTYSVPDQGVHKLGFQLVHDLPPEHLSYLAASPLTVSLLGPSGKGSQKRSSKGRASTKQLRASGGTQPSLHENLLMEAHMDLLPLLLGEVELEEKVGDMLEVEVRLVGTRPATPANLMYTTAMSLYNPPGDLLTSDVLACTLSLNTVPRPSVAEETESEEWSKQRFGPGHVTSPEVEPEQVTRRWFSAAAGPPALSQYRNVVGEERVKDPGKVSTTDESKRSLVRVSWNQLTRTFLDQKQQDAIIDSLVQCGEWLVNIEVKKTLTVERKHTKKISSAHEQVHAAKEESKTVYQARLDLSDLLHPGVNCTRIVAQLERFGRPSTVTTSQADLTNHSSTSRIDQEEEDGGTGGGRKVWDSLMRPSYLVVLVELYRSFRPRRSPQQLLLSVKECVREKLGEAAESSDVCPDQEQAGTRKTSPSRTLEARAPFSNSLLDIVHLLQRRYQEGRPEGRLEEEVEEEEVMEELERRGALAQVRERLQAALLLYIGATTCLAKPEMDVSETYSELTELTEAVLEELSEAAPSGPVIRASSAELLEAARCQAEEGNFDRADHFLLKRMYYYGEKDPDQWVDVAVLSLRRGDRARAVECLLRAICLQPRHQHALLMYGALMSVEGEYETANLMLEAVTSFYPRLFLGWFVYRCFFDLTENQQGADVCLSLGGLCMRDRKREEPQAKGSYWCTVQPLSEQQHEDGLLLSAVHLLSLGLVQLAEMCLSQQRLDSGEDTVPYLYYLAVAHHLQGKYTQSNSHLKQALSISWDDETLWNLMGHNLYRLGETERAMDCFAFVVDNPDPPPEYSLTFNRLGRMLLERGAYEEAARHLLRSVCLSPSPDAWTALAKASYWRGDVEETEVAAREANRLDERASTPWACLGLVNYRRCSQPTLAKHCLYIAQQCGLDDEEMKKEVQQVLYTYGDNKELASISLGDLTVPLSDKSESTQTTCA